MSNIGVLIETGDDGVKEANFGVITAARGDGSHVTYAFVAGISADSCKDILQELPPNIPAGIWREPPQCMPWWFKRKCTVQAYWEYYENYKYDVASKDEKKITRESVWLLLFDLEN